MTLMIKRRIGGERRGGGGVFEAPKEIRCTPYDFILYISKTD